MRRRLPDFCVIGAMKCGTTSFAEALRAHPGIFVPYEKSANYFGLGDRDCCEPGLTALHGRAVKSWPDYQDHYRLAKDSQICGDFSETAYFLPDAASAIARRNPNAKIILIARDPVTRAYSAFNHARAHGLEPMSDFLHALRRPEHDGLQPLLRYRALGNYEKALRRFHVVFGATSVLSVCLEDLIARPDPIFRTVLEHLGQSAYEMRLPLRNQSLALPPLVTNGLARIRPQLARYSTTRSTRRAVKSLQRLLFSPPPALSASDYHEAQEILGLEVADPCLSNAV